MAKVILGIVGPLASGKGAMKKYLEEKYQAKDCRFSTMLRDVLGRLDIPTTRENMQMVSTVLRENFGQDLMSRVIVKDAKDLDSEIVVIDGVRRLSDIKYLADMPNFYLVAIDADSKVRYERMISRNENEGDSKKSFEDFLKDNQAEAEQQIPIVMEQAKFKIDNSGVFEEFFKKVDEVISKILAK
jgi:dephospho-CoA kinase